MTQRSIYGIMKRMDPSKLPTSLGFLILNKLRGRFRIFFFPRETAQLHQLINSTQPIFFTGFVLSDQTAGRTQMP